MLKAIELRDQWRETKGRELAAIVQLWGRRHKGNERTAD